MWEGLWAPALPPTIPVGRGAKLLLQSSQEKQSGPPRRTARDRVNRGPVQNLVLSASVTRPGLPRDWLALKYSVSAMFFHARVAPQLAPAAFQS